MNDRDQRVLKIADILEDGEAALITADISVTYLTGFEHSEGYVFVSKKGSFFLVDFRYIESARNAVDNMEVVEFSSPFDAIGELCERVGAKMLLIESEDVTLSRYKVFCEKLRTEIESSSKLSDTIKAMRIIKSPDEVLMLRKAQKIAEEAYLEVLDCVKVGITEAEISARLEYLMKIKGARKVAFDLITITGKKTSLPHGVPSDVPVREGDFVTFDIGAMYNGYHSDMTRTVAVGCVSDEQRAVYDTVLKAHLEAMSKVKAGVSGYDVDKVARDIIKDAGYGEYFGHSTGHGVGLEIHESPSAGPRSKDILKAGMTVTVEPGIYLPNKFGVRIEDTVLVTEDGYESFASIPKELIII